MRPRASRHVQSLAAAALAALLAASAAAETRYALCVGIDRYSTAGSDLVSCVNDAHGVFTRLARDHARWDAADMTLMADSQATKAAIRNWFQSCPAVAGEAIGSVVKEV